jgi:hypothetical protein
MDVMCMCPTPSKVVEPRLYGAQLNLHPVTVRACLLWYTSSPQSRFPWVFGQLKKQGWHVQVLLALVCWGVVWGVPGMVVAVPLTAGAKISIMHCEDDPLEMWRALEKLMEGKLH